MPRYDLDRYNRNFTPNEARLATTPRGAKLLAKLDAAKKAYNKTRQQWYAYVRTPNGGRPKIWSGETGRHLLEIVELFRVWHAHQNGKSPTTSLVLRELLKIGGVPEYSIERKLKTLQVRYYEVQRHYGRSRLTFDDPPQRTAETWAEWAEAVWAEEQWVESDRFVRKIRQFVGPPDADQSASIRGLRFLAGRESCTMARGLVSQTAK
jgi:hypothetical protein